MEMQVETRLSDQIARYLDLATSEAKLTAANMANVDTPGYRALGMDFEAEMREAMDGVDRGKPARPVRLASTCGDTWQLEPTIAADACMQVKLPLDVR